MPQATPEVFGSHPLASSTDLDDAREVLSDAFLPLDFRSADKSTGVDLRVNVVSVGRITAGYLRFGTAVRIRTVEATEYHVDIPLTGRALMQADHGDISYGSPKIAGVFMPGHTANLDCDSDFSQIALMIPRAELHLELENLLGRSARKPLLFANNLDLTTGPGRTLLQTLSLIDQASKQVGGLLDHPLAAQRLEQVMIESLLLALPHNYTDALDAPATAAGRGPVGRAVELLRASPEYPWTVSELASNVAVSVRSLQEGFRRTLETTPMGYLRALRLSRIRQELHDADAGVVTVTEVAAKWGITHFGRFAASYQARFAEKPSDTLRARGGSR